MAVGIIVPLPAYTLNPAFIASKAEAVGFESLWYHEHPILPADSASPFPATDGAIPWTYRHFSEPSIALAMAAAVTSAGTLSAFQTVSTLPEGYTGRNTCSQIQLTPSGQWLYVPNRGHNSIAGFAVAADGRLTAVSRIATEAVPSAFSLDPEGTFVYAAGAATGRLASYRLHEETGTLTPLETYSVGQRPMWVLTTRLGDAQRCVCPMKRSPATGRIVTKRAGCRCAVVQPWAHPSHHGTS
jgi:hypothetical protein